MPTGRPSDRLADLRARGAADAQGAVILNQHNILVGVVRLKALEQAGADQTAAEAMDPAPKTFRPNVKLVDLVGYMREHDTRSFLVVTTHSGEFLAAITRADAEATLEHDQGEHEHGVHEHQAAEST